MSYDGFEDAEEAAVGTETVLGCSYSYELCKASWHFLAALPGIAAPRWKLKAHASSAGGGGLLTYFFLNFLYVVFAFDVFLQEQLPREGF